MAIWKRWAAVLATGVAAASMAQAQDEGAPRFAAKVYADTDAFKSGGHAQIAIELEVEEHWHIYHPITIGVGIPTTFVFDAPKWLAIHPVRYPTPKLSEFQGQEFLGYESGEIFLADVDIAADAPTKPIEIKIAVSGLACKEGCVLVSTDAVLKIDVTNAGGKPANEKVFTRAKNRLPRQLGDARYLTGSEIRVTTPKVPADGGGEVVAKLKIQPGHHIQDPDPGVDGLIGTTWFIEPVDGIEFKDPQWPAPRVHKSSIGDTREQAGDVTVKLPFSVTDKKFKPGPQRMHVLLRYQACKDGGQCFAPEMAEAILEFDVVPASGAPASGVAETPRQGDEPVAQPPPRFVKGGKSNSKHTGAALLPWQPWEPGLPEKLCKEGKIVYVDFTASWCLTCQQNKANVLYADPVRSKLLAMGVVMLEGDYTREDPRIKEELRRFKRAGVPLNLIYVPGHAEKPIVLRELLTSAYVMEKLEKAAKGEAAFDGEETFWGLGTAGVFLFALLGGIILNAMPCVLPVLSLKLFSLMQQAQDEPERILKLGLTYGAGVLMSFVPLATAIVYFGVAWGGLMQRPEFVIGMIAVTFAFGLALLGVWELRLPGIVENVAGAATTREGFGGSFLNGFMATALATPCVGPFLGAAVGTLVQLPPLVAGLGIMTVGVGLALPMVLLSAFPAWRRFMPKPGVWMVTFKQFMGFILMATVLWLFHNLRFLVTPSEVLAVLTFLLGVAIGCWQVGRITLSDSRVRAARRWAQAVVAMAAGWYVGTYFFPPDAALTADAADTVDIAQN